MYNTYSNSIRKLGYTLEIAHIATERNFEHRMILKT